MCVKIQKATPQDAYPVALMVGELLHEIMATLKEPLFHFDLEQTKARLENFIAQEHYTVFVANQEPVGFIGFIALYESYALYAEGTFGTIPELFVRPAFRSQGIGRDLIEQAKQFGCLRGWTRLEVTTPPLPAFNQTVAFYEREGFSITGGRKLKVTL